MHVFGRIRRNRFKKIYFFPLFYLDAESFEDVLVHLSHQVDAHNGYCYNNNSGDYFDRGVVTGIAPYQSQGKRTYDQHHHNNKRRCMIPFVGLSGF